MIRINVKTYDTIKVKSFINKKDLEIYCRKILSCVPQMDNAPMELANEIWETKVGQSVRSNIGHVISVAGKSRAGNIMLGEE